MSKLTARQFLAQFPDSPLNQGCLENIACPACGQRERFRIEFTGTAQVYDDGSEDDGDHEWTGRSAITCDGPRCAHGGRVRDFTFPGLDALIASCECTEQGWHGPGHTAACPLSKLAPPAR